MLKSILLSMLAGAASALACSIVPSSLHFDTLNTGTVVVTRTWDTESHLPVDTVAISHPADFRTHVRALMESSALVFIGRIDSVIMTYLEVDTARSMPVPDLELTSWADSANDPGTLYLRFAIDTLFKGTLPGTSFWARSRFVQTSCFERYPNQGTRFLNASSGFTDLADLKVETVIGGSEYAAGLPSAHWFDGRYLVSPEFPGLRLDITEVIAGYPVTSLRRDLRVRPPNLPWGKAWLPDGRAAPEASPNGESGRGRNPRPVLR